ncbi:MAG: DUF1573 domain-containing protein [Muribaculaceae bacterium]|nr:DUF1573 domain-containing protein [Muribaculaceae bacterium]MDE6540471.1 DUF1573 domain-containing protein [Muribaculaceae bacterium]
MKHLRILIAAVLSLGIVWAAAAAGRKDGEPAIKFEERAHDFGEIGAEGGSVSHTFEFTNTGTAPLIVVSATASCGCTRPEYTTEPVRPGKKGRITVTYLPSGQPLGEFSKTIRVRTNVGSKRETLRIQGVIIPGTKRPAR